MVRLRRALRLGRSPSHYPALARRFHTVLASGVPRLDLERAEEVRRFALLVDVLYDHAVKLIVSAQALPQQRFRGPEHGADPRLRAVGQEFERAVSRLAEMRAYASLGWPHRASGARGQVPCGARPASPQRGAEDRGILSSVPDF